MFDLKRKVNHSYLLFMVQFRNYGSVTCILGSTDFLYIKKWPDGSIAIMQIIASWKHFGFGSSVLRVKKISSTGILACEEILRQSLR